MTRSSKAILSDFVTMNPDCKTMRCGGEAKHSGSEATEVDCLTMNAGGKTMDAVCLAKGSDTETMTGGGKAMRSFAEKL